MEEYDTIYDGNIQYCGVTCYEASPTVKKCAPRPMENYKYAHGCCECRQHNIDYLACTIPIVQLVGLVAAYNWNLGP